MKNQFGVGRAVRILRQMRNLTQEDFSDVSSRTYVSSVERGLKSPTIMKINELASALVIHPASLLALACCAPDLSDIEAVLISIRNDLTDAKAYIVANRG